jgi:hypothetical protein
MFEPVEMYSYLVRAAGFDFHVEQGKSLVAATNTIERQGTTTTTNDSHPRAVGRITRDGLVDLA